MGQASNSGGTGGTVLPPLKKGMGERKRSGGTLAADYSSQPYGKVSITNTRRAKSLVKPRPVLDANAQFSTQPTP